MKSSLDFAILAPVPEEHLESGLEVVENEDFVAYGSQQWELFPQVDKLRSDEPVPVLIYPSYEEDKASVSYVIKWVGWYVGHVRSDMGRHPEGMKHRPETALNYAADISGYWAVFWHVAKLRKLEEEEYCAISSLQSEKTGKYWKAGSAPRGPEIVHRPSWF